MGFPKHKTIKRINAATEAEVGWGWEWVLRAPTKAPPVLY